MDTLQQLDNKLASYDPTYIYSDDMSVYRRGEQNSREIEALIAQARLEDKNDDVDSLLRKHGVRH